MQGIFDSMLVDSIDDLRTKVRARSMLSIRSCIEMAHLALRYEEGGAACYFYVPQRMNRRAHVMALL